MVISPTFGAALVGSFALFGTVAPLLAHHSFAAEYDSTKTVTVKGTVNKLSWVNPHAYVFVDVKDASGKVTTWAFESLSPNALSRQGWNRNSLKQGEEVTVEGYMAKDGKPLADGSIHANSRGITRSDGRKVFVGSSADEVPSK
jgi:tRNA(Ile2) C34 agmatinyltransferase TiaS